MEKSLCAHCINCGEVKYDGFLCDMTGYTENKSVECGCHDFVSDSDVFAENVSKCVRPPKITFSMWTNMITWINSEQSRILTQINDSLGSYRIYGSVFCDWDKHFAELYVLSEVSRDIVNRCHLIVHDIPVADCWYNVKEAVKTRYDSAKTIAYATEYKRVLDKMYELEHPTNTVKDEG